MAWVKFYGGFDLRAKDKRLARPRGSWLGIFVGAFLVVAGIGLLLYPSISDWRYAQFQNDLKARAASKPTVPTKKTGRRSNAAPVIVQAPKAQWSLPDGTVAHLVIPKIALDTYVVEGTDAAALSKGPGHYEETPLPGQGGNAAFAGHRTMYGHPFRNLDQLLDGDLITVYTKDKKLTYRVIKVQLVVPKNVSVVAPTADSRLTLTTCAPVGSARQRLVITARQENG